MLTIINLASRNQAAFLAEESFNTDLNRSLGGSAR